MPIGEFSERSGLSASRLRAYAAAGLLVPAAIDSASGYRYYSPGQLREAQLVHALRDAGMPIVEIAAVLDAPTTGRLERWSLQVERDASTRHEALAVARRLLAVDDDTVPPGSRRRTEMPILQGVVRTNIGRVRDRNEDAALCRGGLVAVADGMGGHPGGEVASALGLALLEAAFTGRSLHELEAGVRAGNRAICGRAGTDAESEGMGTTLCAAGVLSDGNLGVVNVGDSRAYLWRDHSLQPLTEDHSVTAELIRRGELTERDAVDDPRRSILTRALGTGPDVEVDGSVHPALPGDRLLLCTDGLFNEVAEAEISSLLGAAADLGAVADELVQSALANGGRDNVTVALAEVHA